MKKIIHKYPLVSGEIDLPHGAKILKVDMQAGQPYMWAIFNINEARVQRRYFRVFGTGHQIDEQELVHIATVQDPPYVWHWFEVMA